MKKIKKCIAIILFSLLFISDNIKNDNNNYLSQNFSDNIKEPILKTNLNFEINSEVKIESVLSPDNEIDIFNKDELIDTTSLGEKEIVIKYNDNNIMQESKFKVQIVDTTEPVIEGVKDLTITIGEKIDLLAKVKASDNSNEKINITINGEYNLEKTGTYKLKYIAMDHSGNVSEKEFLLIVLKHNSTTPSSKISNENNQQEISKETESKINIETKEDDSNVVLNTSLNEFLHSATYTYKLKYNYSFVKETNDFYADNQQEIINIIYTSLNEGADNFSFYCNYDLCASDIQNMSKNGILSYIQDYIHPYNSLTKIYYQIRDNYITIRGTKRYSQNDIDKIENKVTLILNDSINESMNITEKVKGLHDYLINNTIYENSGDVANQSAIGALLNGKAICGGYTHAMAIFLNRLNVPNYRITVIGKHTWNHVFINGTWLHLDATWDDPVDASGNGKQYLRHEYFLINESKLKELDINGAHNFNKTIYKEI